MKNIIKIIIAILLIYFGNKLNKSNAGAISQSIIEKYENFCSNGEIIFATIDNEYLETTYGNKIEIKIFEFKINYNYKGENYS